MWLRYNFSKKKSLSHRFTSLPVDQFTGLPVYQFTVISLQSTVHSHHYTTSPQTDNRQQKTENTQLTTNISLRLNRVLDTMALVYRHKSITRTDRNYLLVDSPQFTVISCQFTGLPVNQFTVISLQSPLYY
jgi:hypothetical protein